MICLARYPFVLENTFPTIFGLYPTLHRILAEERVDVIHGHQAFSTMAHEALVAARFAGRAAVFTDHSLFGFADLGSIALNKALKHSLADVDAAICVSHTSKENTVLRACLPPSLVSVIPNGPCKRWHSCARAGFGGGVLTVYELRAKVCVGKDGRGVTL